MKCIAYAQTRNISSDEFRDLSWQTLNFNLAKNDIQHTAISDTSWFTFSADFNVYAYSFSQIKSEEINVLWTTRKRVNVDCFDKYNFTVQFCVSAFQCEKSILVSASVVTNNVTFVNVYVRWSYCSVDNSWNFTVRTKSTAVVFSSFAWFYR
ncbi:hypothetical protein D3C72_1467710 [compost metagenome]